MRNRRKMVCFVLAAFSLANLISCSSNINPSSLISKPEQENSSSAASKAESEAVQLTGPQKANLNFLTELALGKGTEYDFSHFAASGTTEEMFELAEGDMNTCALAFDRERYAYIGCNTSPARIVKYDLFDMKRVGSIDLPANDGRDECRVAALIAVSPDIIIHASYTNPCVFTKINGKTMAITGTLRGEVEEANDKYIRGMTYDGKYVYAATDSTPGKIIQFDPVTMTKVDDIVFENPEISGIFAITICGNYLVGVCGREEAEEAKIFRLDLNDIHKSPDFLTIPEYTSFQSLCTDGQYIYAATFTNPVKVAKVNARSSRLEFVSGFTGTRDEESGNFSIVYNGTDVIVATWQLDSSVKDKLIKLNPSDMSRKDTLVTPCKFPADLMYLGSYIYTCCDKPTGIVLRLKF